MRRTPGALAALLLLLLPLVALAPAAHADPPLGPTAPCNISEAGNAAENAVAAMVFQDGFAVAKGCTKLCKKARAACAKYVKRAITCARKNVDDSTAFDIQVTCPGLKGGALKTCAAPLRSAQDDAHAALLTESDTRLAACDTKAQACAESCNAPVP